MRLALHLAAYNLGLTVLLFASVAVNPRMWLHRMPKAAAEKVPPKTAGEKRAGIITGMPFLLVLLLYPFFYALENGDSFSGVLGIYLLFFFSFDIWDTLVLDLFVVCTVTPRWFMLKGTEKADYRDKIYHLKSGLKGLVFLLIVSAVLTPLTLLLR